LDRKVILERARNPEDRILLAKIIEKIGSSIKYHEISVTDFFDPYQQNLINPVLKTPGISFIWDGGYSGAERRRLVVFPDYLIPGDVDSRIRILAVKCSTRFQKLSHRDFLGSILGLGIKRGKVGDIIVTPDGCQVITDQDISGYIMENLTKVHRVGVKVEEVMRDELQLPDEKVREINAAVSSLRLDAVAAAGYGTSRSKMVLEILAEKVKVNWSVVSDSSYGVKEGDIISIRGRGRVELDKVKGETKKGRILLILKRYQ